MSDLERFVSEYDATLQRIDALRLAEMARRQASRRWHQRGLVALLGALTVWLVVGLVHVASHDTITSQAIMMGVAGVLVLAAGVAAWIWWGKRQCYTNPVWNALRQDVFPTLIPQLLPDAHYQPQHIQHEAWFKQSRLLKLQEQIESIGYDAIEWHSRDVATYISKIHLQQLNSKGLLQSSAQGLFVRMELPFALPHNAVFFSIQNQAQYFESVQFNDLVLGQNVVKRLVKRYDNLVAHTNVDEFNKRFLMHGQHSDWLENHVSDALVLRLLGLSERFQHQLRIELQDSVLTAVLSCAPTQCWAIPRDKKPLAPAQWLARYETDANTMADLVADLKEIADLLR